MSTELETFVDVNPSEPGDLPARATGAPFLYDNGLKYEGYQYLNFDHEVPPEAYPRIMKNLNLLVDEKLAMDSTPPHWLPLAGKPNREINYHYLVNPQRINGNLGITLRTVRSKPENPQDHSEPLIYNVASVAAAITWPAWHDDMERVNARRRLELDGPFHRAKSVGRVAAITVFLFDELRYAQPYDATRNKLLNLRISEHIVTVIAPNDIADSVLKQFDQKHLPPASVRAGLVDAGATIAAIPKYW